MKVRKHVNSDTKELVCSSYRVLSMWSALECLVVRVEIGTCKTCATSVRACIGFLFAWTSGWKVSLAVVHRHAELMVISCVFGTCWVESFRKTLKVC